jgi:hypothetical protein
VCAVDACAVYVCGASHVGRVCMTASAWTVRAAWVSMGVVRCGWSSGVLCPAAVVVSVDGVVGRRGGRVLCVSVCVRARVCVWRVVCLCLLAQRRTPLAAAAVVCRLSRHDVLASSAVHRVRRRDTCRCVPCRVAVAVMESQRCSEWYAGVCVVCSRCDAVAYTAPARDALLHVTACCIVLWCVVGPCRVSLWRGVCHVVV